MDRLSCSGTSLPNIPLLLLALLSAAVPLPFGAEDPASPGIVVWKPAQLAGSPPTGLTIAGDPQVVDSPFGKALHFDGVADGLFLPGNPLDGLSEFTVEAVFRPDSDGPKEQRFLHLGHPHGDRVLLETRVTGDKHWYLDTFILGGKSGLPLIDPHRLHPTDRWSHVAFVVRNGHLANYIDGVLELEAQIDYTPVTGGESSIGVRLNNESWFKGAIYSIRVTPRALTPDLFTDSIPPTP
jgi:hypothetical protein